MTRPWLESQPNDVEALRRLAQTADQAGFTADAEGLLRQAVAHRPDAAVAHADLASLLCRLNRAREAEALLDDVLARRPGTIWALSIKSAVLTKDRRDLEALHIHDQLVALAHQVPVLWINRGHTLAALGRAEEAAVTYRKALDLDPTNGFAWLGLADLRVVPLTADDVAALESATQRAGDLLQKVQLNFALAKALGDSGRFERAFRHYERANRLRGALAPYHAAIMADLVDRTCSIFSREFLAERANHGCDASGPIFIVGMPRSGSTLVEQILASHPLVEGLGELFELPNIVSRLVANSARGTLPEVIAALGANDLKEIGESYLAATQRYRRTDRPFFTDKLPVNWQNAGLIRLILPNARIIDVRRRGMACCFSHFTTYFTRETIVPTSLRDLGRYYRDYVRMMDHLEAVAPGRIHSVQHEILVDDVAGEIRRLLACLQLPFDAACLCFNDNPRAVHTPSGQQVRRPINREGLDRWRSYEPWLDELKQELGVLDDP